MLDVALGLTDLATDAVAPPHVTIGINFEDPDSSAVVGDSATSFWDMVFGD